DRRPAPGAVSRRTRDRSSFSSTNTPYCMYTDIDVDAAKALERIRDLNDAARWFLPDGRLVISQGIAALAAEDQAAILARVRTFDEFTSQNDPWGEHDFGSFEHAGQSV